MSEIEETFKKNIFTEKYNPSDFKFWVLTDRVKSHFPNGKITKDMLLSGGSGLGKSSIIKFLIGENGMYINSGTENSVDMLKKGSKLHSYCAGFSFADDAKYVFFDEIDGASDAFFRGLKGFMDTFKDVIFLATTNHPSKIPVNNLSRMTFVDFDFQNEEERKVHFGKYVRRVKNILTKGEEIEVEDGAVEEMCRLLHPDFRKALQAVQRIKESGIKKLTKDGVVEKSFNLSEAYSLVLSPKGSQDEINIAIHQYATSVGSPVNIIENFDDEFFDYLEKVHKGKISKYADVVICTTRHMEMVQNRVCPKIVLKSLMFSLVKIFKS